MSLKMTEVLDEIERRIHNMYLYDMIDNFDDFNYCRDRVDELLRKLDDALDKKPS